MVQASPYSRVCKQLTAPMVLVFGDTPCCHLPAGPRAAAEAGVARNVEPCVAHDTAAVFAVPHPSPPLPDVALSPPRCPLSAGSPRCVAKTPRPERFLRRDISPRRIRPPATIPTRARHPSARADSAAGAPLPPPVRGACRRHLATGCAPADFGRVTGSPRRESAEESSRGGGKYSGVDDGCGLLSQYHCHILVEIKTLRDEWKRPP